MKLKVCGLNYFENIQAVESLSGVNYTGFIFVSTSPRNALHLNQLPAKNAMVIRVGVFINATVEEIQQKILAFDLDVIQLHGNESPEFCKEVRSFSKVFKAFGIETVQDLEILKEYDEVCDAFVLDKKTAKGGGSGEKYDWRVLANYSCKTPFLLSGGIGLPDALALSQLGLPNCIGYDLNSRFEISPGIKKVEEIELFIAQVKK
jgi:phosphoribosylanthranilate isomerase